LALIESVKRYSMPAPAVQPSGADGLWPKPVGEGQNVVSAFRWAEGHYDRLPVLAAELVDLRVAALFAAGGPPSALAAKAATRTIPIVFSAVDDPVGVGLIPSLSQPGGNITGMSFLNFEIIGKSAQLLKEMVPAAAAIAYLVNPSSSFASGRCADLP
jgi:putative ABC transport system substrate-binding protein